MLRRVQNGKSQRAVVEFVPAVFTLADYGYTAFSVFVCNVCPILSRYLIEFVAHILPFYCTEPQVKCGCAVAYIKAELLFCQCAQRLPFYFGIYLYTFSAVRKCNNVCEGTLFVTLCNLECDTAWAVFDYLYFILIYFRNCYPFIKYKPFVCSILN